MPRRDPSHTASAAGAPSRDWPAQQTLHQVQRALHDLSSTGRTVEAVRLVKSARPFLRQLATATIPPLPPDESVPRGSVDRQREHRDAWKRDRSALLADIRDLTVPDLGRHRWRPNVPDAPGDA